MATIGRDLALAAARNAGLPEDLYMRLLHQESGFNPQARNPTSGAFGVGQAMPATWKNPGFGVAPGGDPNDPNEQLRVSSQYAKAMLDRYDGDPVRMAVAYNWGPGHADKWDGSMGSLPEETRNYVQRVVYGKGMPADLAPTTSMSPTRTAPRTLLDGASGAERRFSPETLADSTQRQKDEPRATFHPGMALQSLGAALAASARGESAAEQLGRVRDQYMQERELSRKQAQEEMQRKALTELVGPDSAYGQALMQGAAPEQVLQAYMQDYSLTQQWNMQDDQQGFTAEQNALNRQFQIDDREDTQDFTSGENAIGRQHQTEERLGGQEFTSTENQLDRNITVDQQQVTQNNWEREFSMKEQTYNDEISRGMDQGLAAQKLIVGSLEATGQKDAASALASMPATAFSDPSMVSSLGTFVKSGAADPTSAMQNYMTYQAMLAAGDTAGAEAFKNDFAKAGGTTVNVGDRADAEVQKQRAIRDSDEMKGINEAQEGRRVMSQALTQMRDAVEGNPNVEFGVVNSALQPVAQIARDLGIASPEFSESASLRQNVSQITKFMSTYMRQPGAGATSDFDAKMYIEASPNPMNDRDTLLTRVDQLLSINDREAARAAYLSQRIEQKSGDNFVTLSQAKKEWDQMVKAGDPLTKPKYRDYSDKGFSLQNNQQIPAKIGDFYRDDEGVAHRIMTQETLDLLNSL